MDLLERSELKREVFLIKIFDFNKSFEVYFFLP